jgi:hypothetical protein
MALRLARNGITMVTASASAERIDHFRGPAATCGRNDATSTMLRGMSKAGGLFHATTIA